MIGDNIQKTVYAKFWGDENKGVFGLQHEIWRNWNPKKKFDFKGIGMKFDYMFGW